MDVFGTALLDYLGGQRDHPIRILRDDDVVDEHSAGLYFAPEPFDFEVPVLADAAGPLLDVGSGAGRHLLWCHAHGVAATGVDISKGAVACAKRRGCASVVLCDVTQDMSPLTGKTFKTITLFGNNVGIGGSFAGAVALLRNLRCVAQPDTRLLLTGLDVTGTDDPAHLAYHAANLRAGRRKGEIRMRLDYRDMIGEWGGWYHPLPSEIEELCGESGWVLDALNDVGQMFFSARLRMAT